MVRVPIPTARGELLAVVDDEYADEVLAVRWHAHYGRARDLWYARGNVPGLGKVLLHRYVWLLAHGELPAQIDHISGDPLDCRLENLRETTPTTNALNTRRAGVRQVGDRWRATVTVAGRTLSCTHASRERAERWRREVIARITGEERWRWSPAT